MPKFKIGDVAVTLEGGYKEGITVVIEKWRGGYVAPYIARVIESNSIHYKVGETVYMSARDMEHKDMQGKRKIYCRAKGCRIYQFTDEGVLLWECDRHYSSKPQRCVETDEISLEEKVDLILDHLGLSVETEPAKTVLVNRKDESDDKDG